MHDRVPGVTFCDGGICCRVCQAPQGVALVAGQGPAVLRRQHWLGSPRPKACTGDRQVHLYWGTGSLGNSPLQQLPVSAQQQLVRQGTRCNASNDTIELRLQRCSMSTTAGALTGSQKAGVLALEGSRRIREQQCPLCGVSGEAACSRHLSLKHSLMHQNREGRAGTSCTLLTSRFDREKHKYQDWPLRCKTSTRQERAARVHQQDCFASSQLLTALCSPAISRLPWPKPVCSEPCAAQAPVGCCVHTVSAIQAALPTAGKTSPSP